MVAAATTLLLESRMNPRFHENRAARVPPNMPPHCEDFERSPAHPDVVANDARIQHELDSMAFIV
jgi:hypothetical protein